MGVRARPLSELNYYPMEADQQAYLIERGKKYAEYGMGGAKFLQYKSGSFFIHSPVKAGTSMSRSAGPQSHTSGRMIVDSHRGAQLGHHASQGYDASTHALIQLSTRYRRWVSEQKAGGKATSADAIHVMSDIPDQLLLFHWPALVAFSFTAKAWGHVLVDGITPIQFNDSAFDQLVLAESRKKLIKALVTFDGQSDFEDIIAGKSGGSIFLLHGPPGVGKTLTAEAIAETLHRPLYYVTMGELGITPDEMEKRLADVLDLCAGWNALTVIDEADVFLEKRSTSDVVRNAMVCVMLRLLEYHQGILFLTTNRVRQFDPAFESRVTVSLRYEHLGAEARTQVWKNLIGRVMNATVDSTLDFEALGRHEMNGRQIKNAVRLAMALAKNEGSPLTQRFIDETIQITALGREDMAQAALY
ncbi:P-loop containing nucleoside triphosphate hydrolase protein [Phlyctochytrium arcticum]|nr:P-loop containing nucleoside triphosphate hydrolase protein [Phlyctochytrium arcticum]